MLIEIFRYVLLTWTNNLNFEVDMVSSGKHFQVPMIILQLLFSFKQAKPWSVNVEAVKEPIFVLIKNLVQKLSYRRMTSTCDNIVNNDLYFLWICHKDRLMFETFRRSTRCHYHKREQYQLSNITRPVSFLFRSHTTGRPTSDEQLNLGHILDPM